MKPKLTLITLVSLCLLLIGFRSGPHPVQAGVFAQRSPPGLFIPVEGPLLSPQQLSPSILRRQYATIDFAQLGETTVNLSSAQASDTVHLNLFEDLTLTAKLERVVPNATGGGYVWLGKIEGSPYSLVSLVVKEDRLAGDIHLPGQIYRVRPAGEGLHVIHQLQPASQPTLGNDAVHRAEAEAEQPKTASAAVDLEALAADGSVIDLMVAYTAAARAQLGGTPQMLLEIDAAVAYANQAFTNSQINTQLRVVHTVEVNYTETNNTFIDIKCLRDPADGCLDHLHALRDTHFADLVTLWASDSTPYSFSGLAGLLSTLNPVTQAEHASFSVLHVGQLAGGGEVMAHEIGHNLGGQHDWFISDGATLDGLFTGDKGYVNLSQQTKTIMAYGNRCFAAGFFCPTIPYFSNPNLTVNGVPIGVEVGTNTTCTAGNQNNPECDADTHLVLNNTARTVANFREPSGLAARLMVQPTPVQTGTTSLDYTLLVQNTGSQSLSGVQVSHTLPAQTTFAGGINQGGVHSNGILTWSGLTLGPYEAVYLTFQVSTPPGGLSSGELLQHTVEATANEGVSLPATPLLTIVDPQTTYLPLVLKNFAGSSSNPAPSVACTPDPPGDSEDIADALTICAGQAVAGQLGGSDFVDVYKISLIGNQLMTIKLNGSGPGDANPWLYPPETTSVNSDPAIEFPITPGNNDAFLTTTRYGGEWYVAVWNFNPGAVDYTLTVTVSPPK